MGVRGHGGSDFQLNLLEAAVMTEENGRYIGGIPVRWTTESLSAESLFFVTLVGGMNLQIMSQFPSSL